MGAIAELIASLLRQSPSITAAMKAGKKTRISARLIRADGTVLDLGPVSSNESSFRGLLKRMLVSCHEIRVRYRVNGREI